MRLDTAVTPTGTAKAMLIDIAAAVKVEIILRLIALSFEGLVGQALCLSYDLKMVVGNVDPRVLDHSTIGIVVIKKNICANSFTSGSHYRTQNQRH